MSRESVLSHYLREDVRSVIQEHARDGDACRAGVGASIGTDGSPIVTWYAHENGLLRLYNLADAHDYERIVRSHRTLHWTLNHFEPDVFAQRIPEEKRDANGAPLRLGGFGTTAHLTLGADWDLADKSGITNPAVLATLDAALAFTTRELRALAPRSVHVAFSGAGGYVFLHHRLLGGELQQLAPEQRERVLRGLTDAWNAFLNDLERRFLEQRPDARGVLKLDAIVNAKRVFKTVLSVHKRFPLCVIPLDAENPHVCIEDARLPLSPQTVSAAARWYATWDEDASALLARLKTYRAKKVRTYAGPQRAPVVAVAANKKAPADAWPPCIRNILAGVDRDGKALREKDGKLRPLATLTNWLYAMGYERDESRAIVNETAQRLGHAGFPLFDAWWGRVSVSSCETILRKGDTYPKLGLGELNVCAPEALCPAPFGKRPPVRFVPRQAASTSGGAKA